VELPVRRRKGYGFSRKSGGKEKGRREKIKRLGVLKRTGKNDTNLKEDWHSAKATY